MKKTFGWLLVLAIAGSWCAPAHSQSESGLRTWAGTDLRLSIRLYNVAQASPARLALAQGVASEVLARASVRVNWTDCTADGRAMQDESVCESPFLPTHLALAVVGDFASNNPAASKSTLGYAVIPGGDALGHNAQVSLQRVEALAGQHDAGVELVLGVAIAHEIAHLLLGSNGHSATGLMRDRWGSAELLLATRGQFQLSKGECQRIRANLVSRWEQQARQQSVPVGLK